MEKHKVILESKFMEAVQHVLKNGNVRTKDDTIKEMARLLVDHVQFMWTFPDDPDDKGSTNLTDIYKSYGI